MRYFRLLVLGIIMLVTNHSKADLRFALVPDYPYSFECNDVNSAKIRQACIAVHGEKWYKDNMIYDYTQIGSDLYFTNCDLTIVSRRCKQDAISCKDLMDIKKVLDYMAMRNDTIYLSVSQSDFDTLMSGSKSLKDCDGMLKNSWNGKDGILRNLMFTSLNYLRIGNYPSLLKWEKFEIINISFSLGPSHILDAWHWGFDEYEKDCEKLGYIDVFYLTDSLRQELKPSDVDFFFDFLMEFDRKKIGEYKPDKVLLTNFYYKCDPALRTYFVDINIVKKNIEDDFVD